MGAVGGVAKFTAGTALKVATLGQLGKKGDKDEKDELPEKAAKKPQVRRALLGPFLSCPVFSQDEGVKPFPS